MIQILTAAQSSSTVCQYKSSLNKWANYCTEAKCNQFKPTLSQVLQFLSSLFNKGLGYASINTTKCALSGVLGLFDGLALGQHPLMIKFMKGCLKLRPPKPRYQITWDANQVLDYIISIPTNENLNTMLLTEKLCALLSLVTAQRAQAIASIKLEDIIWGDPVQIMLSSQLKTTTHKHPNPVLVIPRYDNNINLCVIKCLETYISRTNSYRADNNLFLSTCKPYKPVCSKTVSRWLINVLVKSGVNTDLFHAHSFRHASSSKASRNGLSSDHIMSRVGWSLKSTTFAKYYNKPLDSRSNFVTTILDK